LQHVHAFSFEPPLVCKAPVHLFSADLPVSACGIGTVRAEGAPPGWCPSWGPGCQACLRGFTRHRVTSYERTGVRLVLCNNAHTHDLSAGEHQSVTLCEQLLPRGRCAVPIFGVRFCTDSVIERASRPDLKTNW